MYRISIEDRNYENFRVIDNKSGNKLNKEDIDFAVAKLKELFP